jgi:hypothetical protein
MSGEGKFLVQEKFFLDRRASAAALHKDDYLTTHNEISHNDF